jgi:hypothetical protein
MAMPFERLGPEIHDGPQVLAPPYADLYAHPSFRIRTLHSEGRICVSGVVGNRGNSIPSRNVKVALGITVTIAGILRHYEKIYTMGKSLRPGELVYTEPCSSAPLAYFNEDNGAKYTFELFVDFNRDVIDLSRGNNFQSYTWWAVRPELLEDSDGSPVAFAHGDAPDREGE